MSGIQRAGLSLLIAAGICLVFSWPLARYVGTGIPSSASNIEVNNTRRMIAGDHLQFLYHMWLARDTFTGHTPLFYNLYEFNTGDDAARREVRPYYLPFSLFFTVGDLAGGQAFGWNAAILVSFWLTYLFSWNLARRYQPDPCLAAIVALVAIILPFPWIVLLGGSPTGFAMMWVPILLYGIDRWIADKSSAGAALTGAALFFAEWGDTHVFFFNALIAPCWCVFSYLYHYGWRRPGKSEWLGWIRSSSLLVVFAALVVVRAVGVHSGLQSTSISGGRSISEVSLYSHGLGGLIEMNRDGDGRKIYVGLYGLLLLAAAAVAALWRVGRDKRDTRNWCLLLLLAGIVGIFLLSTGVKNPLGPRGWKWLTALVPPYGMIRQPDKIFCLLPVLLMTTGALALRGSGTAWSRKALRVAACVLLAPLLWDYQSRLNPTICLLDDHQGAYQAVAERAAAAGEVPRAIVIPLWPGNSHYSSLYEYYVSLYRIRMVNGYRPTPRHAYLEEIFEPLQSINSGHPTDAQLDDLLSRGVHYVLLHEDAFPEKVSSFPVGTTLVNLLAHPRLDLLAHEGAVWSFVIRKEPTADKRPMPLPVLFPVRYWEAERSGQPSIPIVDDPSAIGGRYALLSDEMSSTIACQRVRTAGSIAMDWRLRVRGSGKARVGLIRDTDALPADLDVDASDWTWIRIPAPANTGLNYQQLVVENVSGRIDFDAALLTSAAWSPPAPGDAVEIPAVCFFRAGYTLDDLSGVVLRREYDPSDQILYSRHLYLDPGQYSITMAIDSAAPSGTPLGTMIMRSQAKGTPDVQVPMRAGESSELIYNQPDNRFFRFAFRFSREADVTIRAVKVARIN